MATNLTAIGNLTRPGLNAVFGDYEGYPDQWKEIYSQHTSNMAFELDEQMKFTGLAGIIAEGGPVAVDTMGQRISTRYVHVRIGLSFAITAMAIRDNLYESMFPMTARSLKRSMQNTRNTMAMELFNRATDINFPLGDGKPLLAVDHPIDGGIVPNTFPNGTDMTLTAIQQMVIQVQKFRDQAGLLIQTMPTKLIVPPENSFLAEQLLQSPYDPANGNNTINAVYSLKSIPQGHKVNHFITRPNSWFILNAVDNGFKMFQRDKLETNVYADYQTDNLLHKVTERLCFGCSDFRAVAGSIGT